MCPPAWREGSSSMMDQSSPVNSWSLVPIPSQLTKLCQRVTLLFVNNSDSDLCLSTFHSFPPSVDYWDSKTAWLSFCFCFFSALHLSHHVHRCHFSTCLDCFVESRLEGWLSIPNRANIKRYGWKKQVRHVHSGFPPRCCHFLWNVRPLGPRPSSSHCPFSPQIFAVCGCKQ